jgi:hypothetical protein
VNTHAATKESFGTFYIGPCHFKIRQAADSSQNFLSLSQIYCIHVGVYGEFSVLDVKSATLQQTTRCYIWEDRAVIYSKLGLEVIGHGF